LTPTQTTEPCAHSCWQSHTNLTCRCIYLAACCSKPNFLGSTAIASRAHTSTLTMDSVAAPPPRVIAFPNVHAEDLKRATMSSLRDQANLLLSIADIARSEITTCPSALSDDSSSCPSFPELNEKAPQELLAPRMGSLRSLLYSKIEPLPSRFRSVSFDNPGLFDIARKTPSPLSYPPRIAAVLVEASPQPSSRRLSHRSTRLSHKMKHERTCELKEKIHEARLSPVSHSTPPRKSKCLQAKPPDGVTVKKIFRRKFSWKNYPEVRVLGLLLWHRLCL
jgi:hypothetical protein